MGTLLLYIVPISFARGEDLRYDFYDYDNDLEKRIK